MRNMLLVTTLLSASYLAAQTNVQIQDRGGNVPSSFRRSLSSGQNDQTGR